MRKAVWTVAVVMLLIAGTGLLSAQEAESPPPAVIGEARVAGTGWLPIRTELQVLEGVTAWRVNGEEITLEQVKDRALRQYGPYVLQDMVLSLLLQKEAERTGVSVTDEEVGEKILQLRAEFGLRSEAALYTYLRSRRMTYPAFEEGARNYVLIEKVLGDKVQVSEAEVMRFYQQRQGAYRRRESVAYRFIAVPTEAQAQAALEELGRGRPFAEVAKSMVSDPAQRTMAGELQYYERGQRPPAPPEFEAAVFSAPLNQVVGPIKLSGAYWLIRVERKTDPHQFTLEEVRDEIRSQLRKQRLEQMVAPKWFQEQTQGAEIEVVK